MRDGIPDDAFTPVPDQSVSHVLMNPDVAGQTFVYFSNFLGAIQISGGKAAHGTLRSYCYDHERRQHCDDRHVWHAVEPR